MLVCLAEPGAFLPRLKALSVLLCLSANRGSTRALEIQLLPSSFILMIFETLLTLIERERFDLMLLCSGSAAACA